MDKQLLIATLDVCTSVMMVLILAIISITYDANKGVGNLDYVQIDKLIEVNPNVKTNRYAEEYYAISLEQNIVQVIHVKKNNKGVPIFKSNLLAEATKKIDHLCLDKLPFVIYEQKNNDFLANIVRHLAKSGATYGIAKVQLDK